MSKKLLMMSGGMDSLAIALEYMEKYGAENIISLGYNYGQRHFKMENKAATKFCKKYGIERIVLDVPIGQIGGCSLVDHSIPVTTDMSQQRSTVVPMRNAIFLMFAAAVAQVKGCDVITHGACKEDFEAYRDCRNEFFRLTEAAIQSGITNPVKGSENIKDDFDWAKYSETYKDSYNPQFEKQYINILSQDKIDIRIETPLVFEKKEDTMARVLKTHSAKIYKYSYSCYNGGKIQCGRCPACIERQIAFYVNKVKDPVKYENPLTEAEILQIIGK